MVIRGGENIYPREIEEFLLHASRRSRDAQVIGVPDVRYGRGADGLGASCDPVRRSSRPSRLREILPGKLAHYKIPRYVHVVDEFPMTVTGKVRKVQMREESVVLLGLSEAAATEHA